MRTGLNWLGKDLTNPIVLASITAISHKRLDEHVSFYEKAADMGAGAIVLESVVPIEFGNETFGFTQNDLVAIESGLGEKQYMGFALMGPPYPNISSIKYGRRLIVELRKKTKVPLIGSIVNYGTEALMIRSAEILAESGVDGLELNFSCPNITNLQDKDINENYSVILPSALLLEEIRNKTGLKISLKISPNNNSLEALLQDEVILSKVDGISYANAYSGLLPPSLSEPFGGKFGRGATWAPTGVYGPLERMFTFNKLVEMKSIPKLSKLEISVIGGIVSKEHPIEALLLGATTVQISSGILWKSLRLIKESVKFLDEFMQKFGFKAINDFRGISLPLVTSNAQNVLEYRENATKKNNQRMFMSISDNCIKCGRCMDCCCLAIKKNKSGNLYVEHELCSGCGWCIYKCEKNAIKRVEAED